LTLFLVGWDNPTMIVTLEVTVVPSEIRDSDGRVVQVIG
jgi:hypothetical protein